MAEADLAGTGVVPIKADGTNQFTVLVGDQGPRTVAQRIAAAAERSAARNG